jgi:hypothetical protein
LRDHRCRSQRDALPPSTCGRCGGTDAAEGTGGAAAAPFAGWFIRMLPPRVAMIMVAGIVLCLSFYNLARLAI